MLLVSMKRSFIFLGALSRRTSCIRMHMIYFHNREIIQGFSDQTKVADAHFLVLVVELTPFLSISACWFWFQLS